MSAAARCATCWPSGASTASTRSCARRGSPGIVLAGLSAGGMCWFQHGITRSAGRPQPAAALGFLPGSLSVHYDGDPTRRPAYLDAVARGAMPDGYGADDGVGLLFEGTALVRVVSSRPGAHAYRVRAPGQREGADRARDGARARAAHRCPARALARRAGRHPRVPRRALRRRGPALATRRSRVASSDRDPPRSRCSQR